LPGNPLVILPVFVLITSANEIRAEDMVYKCRNQNHKLIYQQTPCNQGIESVSSWKAKASTPPPDIEPLSASNGTLVINSRESGHYLLDATINEKPLTFVIDTGASIVSLPRPIAFLARISCKDQISLKTANGTTSGCTAVISKLKFGPFLMENVSATIVPNLDQPLLGMNVLKEFKIEQDGGEMRISIKN